MKTYKGLTVIFRMSQVVKKQVKQTIPPVMFVVLLLWWLSLCMIVPCSVTIHIHVCQKGNAKKHLTVSPFMAKMSVCFGPFLFVGTCSFWMLNPLHLFAWLGLCIRKINKASFMHRQIYWKKDAVDIITSSQMYLNHHGGCITNIIE